MRIGRTLRFGGILDKIVAAGAMALLGWAVFGTPGLASAQDGASVHEITWAHPSSGDVASFVVTISPVKGPSPDSRTVDLGKPTSQRSGVFEMFSALVVMDSDEFLSIAAIGVNGQSSAPSAWSGVPPTRPGQPKVVSR